MAKNYAFGEAVKYLADNEFTDDKMEIMKKFPYLTNYVLTIVNSSAAMTFINFADCMPEFLTARKVDKAIRDAVSTTCGDTVVDVPADDANEPEVAPQNATDYMSMSGGELSKIIASRKLRKKCIDTMGDVKKASMAKFLTDLDADGDMPSVVVEDVEDEPEDSEEDFDIIEDGVEESEEELDDDAVDSDDSAEKSDYDGMTPVELFKECRARGIEDVKPKKPAKTYIDLLMADDAKSEDTEESATDEDEDWDL